MKWDISKENNIMDKMNINIDDKIPEDIYNKDISSSEIRRRVFAELELNGKSKKHIKKKFLISLVAAAMSVVLLATFTVGAAGAFNAVLSEHFAGDDIDGIYSGGNTEISIASGYQAEFMGIAGDENNAGCFIKLRKTDGSNFVDSTENTFISYSDYEDISNKERTNDKANTEPNTEIDVTCSAWSSLKMSFGNYVRTDNLETKFNFDSEKVINFELGYYNASRNIKGETLSFKQKSLYIYHIDKIIYTLNYNDWNSAEIESEINQTPNKFLEKYEKEYNEALSENLKNLKENQVITNYHCYPYTYTVIATKTKLDISLDLSTQLNYKDSVHNIKASGNVFENNGTRYIIQTITANPFDTELFISSAIAENSENFSAKWLGENVSDNKIIIKLKNGKSVNGYISTKDIDTNNDPLWSYFKLKVYYEDNSGKWLTVNPKEITSIEINGNIITAE